MTRKLTWQNLSLLNSSFLILTPIVALIATIDYLYHHSLHWSFVGLFFLMYILTGMAITAGYHRLFAHRSYKAATWLRVLYLCFGAAAMQNSALKWCADHRRHHNKVDSDADPYNIHEGFWYAHILWVFFKSPPMDPQACPDLRKDPWVMWQDRNYLLLAGLFGFLLPTLLGALLGDAWAGFLFGGLLRVVVVHHCTFFINSLCHMVGKQTYTDENSARDSLWLALFTYGEGYHNFHHKFQADYRNGLRWYHFDPTKWWIATMAYLGVTRALVKVPEEEIFKAKLRMQEKNLKDKLQVLDPLLLEMRQRVEAAQRSWKAKKRDYQQRKKDLSAQGRLRLAEMRFEIEQARLEFQNAYAQYRLQARRQLAMAKMS